MRASSLLALVLGAAAAGCSIPLEDGSGARVDNRCEKTSDCAGVGVCAAIGGTNACVVTNVDLQGVLIEVRPSPTPSIAPDTSYLLDPANPTQTKGAAPKLSLVGRDGSGIVETWSPQLPPLVTVTKGKILVAANDKEKACAAADLSIAADIELDRVALLDGLPPAHYPATTDASRAFSLSVPPDAYDVYVVPKVVDGCIEPFPPAWIPFDPKNPQPIQKDTDLNITLKQAKILSGDITVPMGVSLDGWIVELVEQTSGRLISTTSTLAQKPLEFTAHFENRYFRSFDWSVFRAPVIRLRPKDGVPGPTVHWDLSTVDINGTGTVSLTLADVNAKPKWIEASVRDEAGLPVSASVSLESTDLSGLSNAAFKISFDTDADGAFASSIFQGHNGVWLLPGKYRVLAVPSIDQSKALAVENWEITAATQCCGKSITVSSKLGLLGRAVTPAGGPMFDASVVASPSLPPPQKYFDGALGQTAILPREASALPDPSGGFTLGVDSGQFDFSVRPRDGSLYPWLVRPRISSSDLGTLVTAFPAVLAGTIRDPSGSGVAAATVRAWLPVAGSAPTDAPTVIQIGETKTDESGGYVLPLPASITPQ